MGVYRVELAEGVEEDLVRLPAFYERTVMDAIETQLRHEPTKPSRNRKILVSLVPPWPSEPPVWELRVGEFRVFYDVAEEEGIVYVRAVRRKPPHKRTEEVL